MAQSSIGSGAGTDSNENHAADGLPGKTMGEDPQSSPVAPAPATQHKPAEPAPAAAENELTSADEVVPSLPTGTTVANPGDFPDGPNVGPSPWEKDAAQGKG